MEIDFKEEIKCFYCDAIYLHSYNYCPICGSLKPYGGTIRNVGLIILNCLNSIRVNAGRSLLKNVLLASRTKYVIQHLTNNDFFGSLNKNYTSKELLERIDYLIEKGYIDIYESEAHFKRPLITLSKKGNLAIKESDDKIIRERI